MGLTLLVPTLPLEVWLVSFALMLAALYALWHEEARALYRAHPSALRIVIAMLVALGLATPLFAYPIGTCDWDRLLSMCGGSEACAWAAYVLYGCPLLP